MNIIWSVLLNAGIMFLVMNLVFLVYKKTGKASWVDTAWAAGIGLGALGYWIFLSPGNFKTGVLTLLMATYAGRLSHYLLRRTLSSPEDGRYLSIQKRWSRNLEIKFYLFFHFQGVLAVILSSPVLIQAISPLKSMGAMQFIAVFLFILSFAGEALSDKQLKSFKSNSNNRTKVCKKGLWKFSRHPNYFFGFLVWCSFSLFVLAEPRGYLSLSLPALMLYFYLFVTGIPETEKQALKSKGRSYLEYQLTTSPFVPWIPRKQKTEVPEEERYV